MVIFQIYFLKKVLVFYFLLIGDDFLQRDDLKEHIFSLMWFFLFFSKFMADFTPKDRRFRLFLCLALEPSSVSFETFRFYSQYLLSSSSIISIEV